MTCPSCGQPLDPQSQFCGRCGKPRDAAVAPHREGDEPTVVPVRLDAVLEGKWKLERKIGEGGMGSVYLAQDLALDRPVAVKILTSALMGDPEVVSRFEREARLTASLEHPNIVPVYAVGSYLGRPFMVMKKLEGRTLEELLRDKGVLSMPDTLYLMRQLCAGLALIHSKGYVHRDIKAGNVFVASDGHATLLDFGILRTTRGEALTRAGVVMGTPQYMSPEQALGARDVDHRADLYALAVLLYECLTGTLPFQADNELQLVQLHAHQPPPDMLARAPWLPQAVAAVVTRALAKRPEDRFASAQELLAALEQAGAGANAPPPDARTSPSAEAPGSSPAATPSAASAGQGPTPAPAGGGPASPPAHTVLSLKKRGAQATPSGAGAPVPFGAAGPGAGNQLAPQGGSGLLPPLGLAPATPGGFSTPGASPQVGPAATTGGVPGEELRRVEAPLDSARGERPQGGPTGAIPVGPSEAAPVGPSGTPPLRSSGVEAGPPEAAPRPPQAELSLSRPARAFALALGAVVLAGLAAGAYWALGPHNLPPVTGVGRNDLDGSGPVPLPDAAVAAVAQEPDSGGADSGVEVALAEVDAGEPDRRPADAGRPLERHPVVHHPLAAGRVNVLTTHRGEPYWAQVVVDGVPRGRTPLLLDLPPGKHLVRVDRTGFRTEERQIKVASGRLAVLRIALTQ